MKNLTWKKVVLAIGSAIACVASLSLGVFATAFTLLAAASRKLFDNLRYEMKGEENPHSSWALLAVSPLELLQETVELLKPDFLKSNLEEEFENSELVVDPVQTPTKQDVQLDLEEGEADDVTLDKSDDDFEDYLEAEISSLEEDLELEVEDDQEFIDTLLSDKDEEKGEAA